LEEARRRIKTDGVEEAMKYLLKSLCASYSLDLTNYSKSINLIEKEVINIVLYTMQKGGKDFCLQYMADQRRAFDDGMSNAKSNVAYLNARDKDLTVKYRKVQFYSDDRGIIDKEVKYRHETKGVGGLKIPKGMKNPVVPEIFCKIIERKILTYEANLANIDLILNTNTLHTTVLESVKHKRGNEYYTSLCENIMAVYKAVGEENIEPPKRDPMVNELADKQYERKKKLNQLTNEEKTEEWFELIKEYDATQRKIERMNKHIFGTPAFLRKVAYSRYPVDLRALSITRKKELVQAFFRDLNSISFLYMKELKQTKSINSEENKRAKQKSQRKTWKKLTANGKIRKWREENPYNMDKKKCASESHVCLTSVYNNWKH
jgi:hypothetical protein